MNKVSNESLMMKVCLVFIFVLTTLFSKVVLAAASWPNPLIITGDMFYAQQGTVLFRIPINESFSGYKVATGTAFLTVDGCKDIGMSEQGVFSISEHNDIGVAFVGTLSMAVSGLIGGYQENKHTKSKYDDNLASVPESSKRDCLSRLQSPSAYLGRSTITISGEVQIIKLTAGTLKSTSLDLPSVYLSLSSNIFQDWSGKGTDILTTNTIAVNGQRTCQITAAGTSIDFGDFPANVSPGELARNKVTGIAINCTGIANTDTKVTMSIDSPSENAGGDPSAIGMNFGNVASANLVVKAKRNLAHTPNCSNSVGWLDFSINHEIDLYDAQLDSVSGDYPIYWSLCRKTNEPLPVGTFNGIATISIVFK